YYLSTIITNNNHRVDLNFSVYLLIPIYYRAIFCMAILGQYCGNKNKKPTTTKVIGYIMETAGVDK
ncbi:hypothetical protein, partial [Staphylococcus haemolyticus]|uniref:hypothetical protein n=1 Tax=Staphylococcus haemolyticus TaxID=1283 RepID=UPI001D0D1029